MWAPAYSLLARRIRRAAPFYTRKELRARRVKRFPRKPAGPKLVSRRRRRDGPPDETGVWFVTVLLGIPALLAMLITLLFD